MFLGDFSVGFGEVCFVGKDVGVGAEGGELGAFGGEFDFCFFLS
jgi:hypothetical protein